MKITKILMSMALLSISSMGLASYRRTATKLTPAALSAMNSGTAQTVTPGIVRTGVINTNPQFVPMAVNSQPYSTKSNITGPSISNQSSSTSNSSLYSWLLAGLATLGFVKNDATENSDGVQDHVVNIETLRHDAESSELYETVKKLRSNMINNMNYLGHPTEIITKSMICSKDLTDLEVKLIELNSEKLINQSHAQYPSIYSPEKIKAEEDALDKKYRDIMNNFADRYVECKQLSEIFE